MTTPDDNTRITANDDTVIGTDASDDTIIRVPIEETVVGSVEVIDTTVIDTVVPDDSTVITLDDTIIPESTTDQYNTILRSMLDTSESVRALIEEIDDDDLDDSDAGAAVPPKEAVSRFRLRHLNGTKYSLTTPVILGRLPSAPLRGEQGVSLIVLASPAGIVSSTHARVEMVGDVVVVTDLRSTNGTRVIIPGKPTILLAPGDSMALAVGAIIDLGDGNRLEVLG